MASRETRQSPPSICHPLSSSRQLFYEDLFSSFFCSPLFFAAPWRIFAAPTERFTGPYNLFVCQPSLSGTVNLPTLWTNLQNADPLGTNRPPPLARLAGTLVTPLGMAVCSVPTLIHCRVGMPHREHSCVGLAKHVWYYTLFYYY